MIQTMNTNRAKTTASIGRNISRRGVLTAGLVVVVVVLIVGLTLGLVAVVRGTVVLGASVVVGLNVVVVVDIDVLVLV